jgi:predicted AlkP superfamily phosphohydrolase/phosphomutase
MKPVPEKVKKTLVIGIDGVPYPLLNIYMKQDVMPNLKKILSQGFRLHEMNASIPDISSVSWTSFNTGVNPGEHGIYGFTDLKPDSYSLRFPNSGDVQAPPFWDILGKRGRKTSTLFQAYHSRIARPCRSIILNVPHTYPALPMNGVLVSGFVAVDLKKAVFPESVYPYLRSIDYLIDVDAEKAKEDKQTFMQSLFECFEIRKKAISHFFTEESWDLFFACITESDRLHHFFFDASEDKENPYHESFLRFYSELDKFLKHLYDAFIQKYKEGFFMVLSDHGFTRLRKEVYLNRFLEEKGFLVLRKDGNFYERIGEGTKAFDMDPGRIYFHDRDRYPRGAVRKEERLSLSEEIREALTNLRGEDGEKIIKRIYEKDEIYHGPYSANAPDLVCLPNDGYDLKGSLQKSEIFGQNVFTGMHTWQDAFCLLPEEIAFSEKPSIQNLTEYVLQYHSE